MLSDGAHRAGDQNNLAGEIDLNHGLRSQPWPRYYIIPCFSNAATALLPSSNAFLTSFSPRAFSSALLNTSVAASTGITQTPSMSPKRNTPGRMRNALISMAMRKSTTFERGAESCAYDPQQNAGKSSWRTALVSRK